MNWKFKMQLEACGLSQKGLSDIAEIHPNTISRIVKGGNPDKETAKKLCKVLGCHMDDIFSEVWTKNKVVNMEDERRKRLQKNNSKCANK